jgi:hypothetical protein
MNKLWAIHIPGPDDYHPAPSEATAIHMAAKHNAAMAEWIEKQPPNPARPSIESVMASVVEWPFEAAEHAEDIKNFDYAGWGLEGGAS